MSIVKNLLVITSLAVLSAACSSIVEDDSPTISKDEALRQQKGDGLDFCELQGWYEDGICDDFCLYPDPDCADECPDVCEAMCAGEPEPEVPAGCPVPTCDCQPVGECPDVCEAVCAGEPEPEVPAGCPVPTCDCQPVGECPDVCEAVCAGEPEPEVPAGCPVPTCDCPAWM